ncbi:MAG: FIST C-terminal domain-containing protein [Pelosinus sp.]|nr:FIST C-terminal domain-containing protein [Pelosinus sp.]
MYIKHSTISNIVKAVIELSVKADDVVLLAIADKNKPDIPELIRQLNQTDVTFIGGIFPGVIDGNNCYEEGTKLFVLPAIEQPLLVKNISQKSFQLPEWTNSMEKAGKKYMAMIIIDGFSSNISGFLTNVFDSLGGSVSYIGGGAGCILKHQPCIFTPEGFFQDAAVIALVRSEGLLGVGHGFKRFVGPIIVTRSYDNVIAELNWENAFTVYRKIVERDCGQIVTMDNFLEFNNDYLFILTRECSEDVVRTPIGVRPSGELILFCEVPENTVLYIAKGEQKSILKAAGQIGRSYRDLRGKSIRTTMVFDCMGRRGLLQEKIDLELAAVNDDLIKNFGVGLEGGMLTFGEIASDGNGFLEYYNKTLVVGAFYE